MFKKVLPEEEKLYRSETQLYIKKKSIAGRINEGKIKI